MKKNGQYVGVDEKYIPEEEKYVDNGINEEIKDSVNDGLRSVKNYVTDGENQENLKQSGKKGFKVLKGLGIGYLIFIGVVIIFVIGVFVAVFINMAKMNDRIDDVFEKAGFIIDKATEQVDENSNHTSDGYDKMDIDRFNSSFELSSGSEVGLVVQDLLDKVVTNNKTEPDHIITVVYNGTMTTVPDEIVALKQNFEYSERYEVSLDYDSNGFVNKVTIK